MRNRCPADFAHHTKISVTGIPGKHQRFRGEGESKRGRESRKEDKREF
ncbi:MAG: hypothetical protein HFH24_02420 [Ruminococcus sp.]|nr:hypothetical protein [Ruminococcus sp.]